MSETEPSVKCTYTRLETGIHHITFLVSNNQAMDQCIAHMTGIYDAHPPDDRLMFLFDLRPAGLPPLRYMLRSAKQFYAQRPVLPETRAAYIYQSSALVALGQNFLGLLGLNTARRFFPSDQEAEAISWLLEDSEDPK